MDKAEVSYNFKRKIYVGQAYLIDINSKVTIATGQGTFDTEALTLNVQFDCNTLSLYGNLLTVLETADGFFAPLMIRDFYSMGWGGQSSCHGMKRCMHWSLSKGITYILEEFDEIQIAVDALPEEKLTQQFDNNGKNGSIELKKSTKFSHLDTATFSRYSCEANSTYSWSSGNIRVRSAKPLGMNARISFTIKDITAGGGFTFQSLSQALLAFKAYWMLIHNAVDCDIIHFKLGPGIDFIFSSSKLYAPHDDVPEFRSILSVDTEMKIETLAKCIYFTINPDIDKQMSFTSKIGLSLSTLIRHSYDKRPELLEHEAVSLIIGFQSIAESIAQNKISQTNKANKARTLSEIERVLQVVQSIDDELSNEVRDFYLKDKNTIYQALSRPTFKRSVEVALDELGINKSDHNATIAVVNKARKQIVHFENYSHDNLTDLITTARNEIKKDSNGNIIQMSLGVKVGELDKLYALMLDMMRQYFNDLTV